MVRSAEQEKLRDSLRLEDLRIAAPKVQHSGRQNTKIEAIG